MRRRKVFGIGWAKTGTTTLGRCFEILGYNHQGQNLSLAPQIMRGDFSKTLRIAAATESFEDWPWISIFRELDQAFPGSRSTLTTRAPQRRLASYLAMLWPRDHARPICRKFVHTFTDSMIPPPRIMYWWSASSATTKKSVNISKRAPQTCSSWTGSEEMLGRKSGFS
jgi:hypothetical protein